MRVSGKILPFVVDDEWEVKKKQIADVFSRIDHQGILDKKKELSEEDEKLRRDCKALIQKWHDDKRECEEENAKSKKREREEEDEGETRTPKEVEPGLEIPMFNNKREQVGVMLVCPCYYDVLKKYRYHDSKGYAGCGHPDIAGHVHLYIAKTLMKLDIPQGHVVDHINSQNLRNAYDNRCSNLRVVTRQQNAQNKRKIMKPNTGILQSIYNNVSYDRNKNKWSAGVTHNGQHLYLGYYDTDIQAAEAFDCFVFHNRDALNLNHRLNFPDKDYISMTPYKRKIKSYTGITKRGNRYLSRVRDNRKEITIGTFRTEQDAARAYDNYIVIHDIAKKKLNFPEEHPGYNPKRIETEKEDCGDGIHCYLRSKAKGVNAANIKINVSDYERVKYYAISIFDGRPFITVNGKNLKLYRYILGITDPAIHVEHFPESNPCNCARENIREGSYTTNSCFKQPREGKSYVGVHTNKNSWEARVGFNKTILFNKCFKSEYDAARARDLYLLSRTDLPDYRMNFTDWNNPGVKDQWREKMASLGVVFDAIE